MVQIPTFEIMTKAHGHMCPGIALGYKMAVVVGKWVGDEDKLKLLLTPLVVRLMFSR
ncbi:MAG TPA: FmdE family protein [Methanocorpusculum sp.]|nr:FmdE family protein [Methanocorpusculum sp.]